VVGRGVTDCKPLAAAIRRRSPGSRLAERSVSQSGLRPLQRQRGQGIGMTVPCQARWYREGYALSSLWMKGFFCRRELTDPRFTVKMKIFGASRQGRFQPRLLPGRAYSCIRVFAPASWTARFGGSGDLNRKGAKGAKERRKRGPSRSWRLGGSNRDCHRAGRIRVRFVDGPLGRFREFEPQRRKGKKKKRTFALLASWRFQPRLPPGRAYSCIRVFAPASWTARIIFRGSNGLVGSLFRRIVPAHV